MVPEEYVPRQPCVSNPFYYCDPDPFLMATLDLYKSCPFLGGEPVLFTFRVDCTCKGHGILSTYVEAENREDAERMAAVSFSRSGYFVVGATSHDLDEIPVDCPYIGSQGQLMPSRADQERKP